MKLDEAKQYISFCVKAGIPWDEDELLSMSDEDIIAFAEEQADKADAMIDAWKERSI